MQSTDMRPRDGFVPVDVTDVSLDRARINNHGQIQLPQQTQSSDESAPTHDGYSSSDSGKERPHGLRSSLNAKRHRAASKVKKAMHFKKDDDHDPAADSSILARPDDEGQSRLKEAMPNKHDLKDFTHNPVATVKSKVSSQGNQEVAGQIAAKEVPYEKEDELIKAHDAIELARTDKEKLLAEQDYGKLLKERQTSMVRWTLDRHVTKVRVLPRDTVVRKPLSTFQRKNAQGDIVTDWESYGHHLMMFAAQRYGGQYVGYGSDPPAPSKQTIMPNIERLIVASAPFQEIIMTTRRVYRWEDPTETSKYLIAYLVLWYFNLLLPGMLSAVVYYVIERYVHGMSIEDLREDIRRSQDHRETARSLSEFIEKTGDEQWGDEIVKALGPWLMMQLADMANFFEAVRNFYEWRVPHRTMITLSIFVVGIIATTFVPLWLIVKLATFGAGVTFFGLFPIATNYPDLRLLASPSKRIFWNIPTHAEWAIKSLQSEGSRYQEEHTKSPHPYISTKEQKSPGQEHDYSSYTAHYEKAKGHLVISTTGIRFVSKHGNEVHWTLQFDQINNVEKQNRVVQKNIPTPKQDSGKDLKIVSKAGKEWILQNMDKRDQAFSQVVGFSDTAWQVVW